MTLASDFTSVFSINPACRKLVAKGPNGNHLTAALVINVRIGCKLYFLYHRNFELLLNEAVNKEYF